MKRLQLNNDGLKKFLPYFVEAASKGKLLIKDNMIRVGNIEMEVSIPSTELLSEYGEAAATQGPVGTMKDPSTSVPNTSEAGRKTGVQKIGRANKEREEEQRFKEMAEKLGNLYLTKDELKSYMDRIEKSRTNKIQKAFDSLGQALG